MNLIRQVNESQLTAGFILQQQDEGAGDTLRIFHTVTDPSGKQHWLDHNQREYIDQDTFSSYVTYFKKHGKFPVRADINSKLPLTNADVERLAAA